MKRNVVIIPAAGSGSRMGPGFDTLPKQFLPLGGLPILLHTLKRFESCEMIHGIVIATSADRITEVRTLAQSGGISKIHAVVEGGKERQDSVFEGLKATGDCEIVLVHDAVRPFVSPHHIGEVISASARQGAAVLAVPSKDTVKLADKAGNVASTPNRQSVWLVQTPQAFRYDLLMSAFEKARKDNFYGTDDAMLVERMGAAIKLVSGDHRNIKITSPDDLQHAEAILQSFDG